MWENLTIVGDWFAAYSIFAELGHGYKQTIFTRHAPTIQNIIESFDQELKATLGKLGWTGSSSKEEAMKEIKEIIAKIEKEKTANKK